MLASSTEGPQEQRLPLRSLLSQALGDSLLTVLPTPPFRLFCKAYSTSGPLHGVSLPDSPAPTYLQVSNPKRPLLTLTL